MSQPLRIALAGLGTVGCGVLRVLTEQKDALAARTGRKIEVVAVSARRRNKKRAVDIDRFRWVERAEALAECDADVIVELIGGDSGPARVIIESALESGKHVVTANKALLAKTGAALAKQAEKRNLALKFEAAVAGGIPIVKSLRESLIAFRIDAVRGILNGTCNYILTQMEASGRPFAEILREAQELGYAEADPRLDVGGSDTAHKLALLSSLAFGTAPDLQHMTVEGIEHIKPEDMRYAREFGYRIKLLGIARRTGQGIDQRVQPAMVRAGTPLADVDGTLNAVVADTHGAGHYFFEGRGAGEAPTASAVVSDLVDIARGNIGPAFGRPAESLAQLAPSDPGLATAAFYLRFEVLDVPGVLADIAGQLAQAGVSIESMLQRGRSPGEAVSIVMITHQAEQGRVARALKAIAASDKVRERPCMIPMESA